MEENQTSRADPKAAYLAYIRKRLAILDEMLSYEPNAELGMQVFAQMDALMKEKYELERHS